MTDTIRTHTDRDPFLTLRPEPWMAGAACATADPDLFFPTAKGNETVAARKICAGCDVVEQCAEYAVRTRQTVGVWGNLSRAELRRRIKDAS